MPAAVDDRVVSVQSALPDFDNRSQPTLLVKRLDPEGRVAEGIQNFASLIADLEDALEGTAPMAARIDTVGVFEHPPAGPSPVVYLAVESPGVETLHQRLCRYFPPVTEIEGEDFVPHVTVARGGDPAAAARLDGMSIDPVEWTIEEVACYSAEYEEVVRRYSLPV